MQGKNTRHNITNTTWRVLGGIQSINDVHSRWFVGYVQQRCFLHFISFSHHHTSVLLGNFRKRLQILLYLTIPIWITRSHRVGSIIAWKSRYSYRCRTCDWTLTGKWTRNGHKAMGRNGKWSCSNEMERENVEWWKKREKSIAWWDRTGKVHCVAGQNGKDPWWGGIWPETNYTRGGRDGIKTRTIQEKSLRQYFIQVQNNTHENNSSVTPSISLNRLTCTCVKVSDQHHIRQRSYHGIRSTKRSHLYS